MMRIVLYILLMAFPFFAFSQKQKPKLVLGIVVDQMRYDYLTRFWDKYSSGGFKKIINEGFNCKNTNYNYMPTQTGPGHASIYTGTTPQNHGIIANQWYDKVTSEYTYCVGDTSFRTLGSLSKRGRMSPKKLLGTTITDELKLATNNRSKVIGVSIKDRGAILPAGHNADAAYWFEGGDSGKWISSTYYMNKLPKWVQKINKNNASNNYLNGKWETLLPIDNYVESITDNNSYERLFTGELAPVFPHDLSNLRFKNDNYSLLASTPFGNTFLKELILEAIEGEGMGKDEFTDFLAISFSSTDYIGHRYGPMSVEIEDTYLRLDKDLEEILNYLDENFEKDEVLLFLTSDHGVVNVPQYLIDNNIPAGYFDTDILAKDLKHYLSVKYGADTIISNVSNYQVFLNHNFISSQKWSVSDIEKTIADFLLTQKGIAKVLTASSMKSLHFSDQILGNTKRGFHLTRSGDVSYVLESGWIPAGYFTGTTHGSPYSYDTHVPLLWYGAGIKKGASEDFIVIPDIAATIAALLEIQMPSACTGKPISKLIK